MPQAQKSHRPLPVTIEEIGRDWLVAALRMRCPDVSVQNVEIVDINRGTCTKIRLRFDMDEAGKRAGVPETVILKGGFESHSRSLGFMHEMEVRGYRDVLSAMGLHSPACYFADYDRERQQGIVIIEDLVARGVTFCNPLKPQTHDQVARRLTMLARFHAKSWNSPELAPGRRWNVLPEMMAVAPSYMKQYVEPNAWRRFVELPRGAAASVRFHDPRWMADALDRMFILSRRLPQCVIHGDTHLGNLYIDPDGTPGFFNSQPQRAPAVAEVAYHVAGALDPADRPRWEGALVRHYLDELGRNGVAPPDFDAWMQSYAAFLALGFCIFMVNESFYQPEAINTAYTARFSAAMIDHRTMDVLKAIA